MTFIVLTILRKVSICGGWFLFGVSCYVTFNLHLEEWSTWSMDNNMVSKIRFEMSTTNFHSLQFKIRSHLKKKKQIWMTVHHSTFHMQEKRLKNSNIAFAIFISFLHWKKKKGGGNLWLNPHRVLYYQPFLFTVIDFSHYCQWSIDRGRLGDNVHDVII